MKLLKSKIEQVLSGTFLSYTSIEDDARFEFEHPQFPNLRLLFNAFGRWVNGDLRSPNYQVIAADVEACELIDVVVPFNHFKFSELALSLGFVRRPEAGVQPIGYTGSFNQLFDPIPKLRQAPQRPMCHPLVTHPNQGLVWDGMLYVRHSESHPWAYLLHGEYHPLKQEEYESLVDYQEHLYQWRWLVENKLVENKLV